MKTDKKLRKALEPEKPKIITLVVAQRISTVKDADQILVLENGKVVGHGKHYHLLKTSKVYREIVASQFSEKEFESELKIAEKEGSHA